MNYPAVGTPERRERDLELIKNPGRWPLPNLPLKRLGVGDGPAFGTIAPIDVATNRPRIKTGDGEKTYPSFEAILEDGWAVD
jgi:hypothetical protein